MKYQHAIAWAAAAAVGLLAASGRADDEPKKKITVRGIVRNGIDKDGNLHGNRDLAKATGLKRATALTYKVLLIDPATGKDKPFDEKKEVLKVGDQFRLWIESHSDAYIYVFHEGPDGMRRALIPDKVDKAGNVPMVKADQPKMIPNDATYFEVEAPPGNEVLKVFASPEKRPDLTPKEAFENPSNLPKGQQIELKSKQDKVFEAAQQSGPKKAVTTNDVKSVAERNEELPNYRLRGLRWEPEAFDEEEGRTILQGSYDENKRPELFFEIKLKSKDKQ